MCEVFQGFGIWRSVVKNIFLFPKNMQTTVLERFPPPVKPVNFNVDHKYKYVKFSRNDNYGNYGIAGTRRRTIAQGKTMQWPRQMTQSDGVVFVGGMNNGGYKPPISFKKIDKGIPVSGHSMQVVSSGGPESDGRAVDGATTKIQQLIALVKVKLTQFNINIGNIVRIGTVNVQNGQPPGTAEEARAVLDGLRQLVQPRAQAPGPQPQEAPQQAAGPNAQAAVNVLDIAQQALDREAADNAMDVDPIEEAIAEISDLEAPAAAQPLQIIPAPNRQIAGSADIAEIEDLAEPVPARANILPPAVGIPQKVLEGRAARVFQAAGMKRGGDEDDDGGMAPPSAKEARTGGDEDEDAMDVDDNVAGNARRLLRPRRRPRGERLGNDLPLLDEYGNMIDRRVHLAVPEYIIDNARNIRHTNEEQGVADQIMAELFGDTEAIIHQPAYQKPPGYAQERFIDITAHPPAYNNRARGEKRRHDDDDGAAADDDGPNKVLRRNPRPRPKANRDRVRNMMQQRLRAAWEARAPPTRVTQAAMEQARAAEDILMGANVAGEEEIAPAEASKAIVRIPRPAQPMRNIVGEGVTAGTKRGIDRRGDTEKSRKRAKPNPHKDKKKKKRKRLHADRKIAMNQLGERRGSFEADKDNFGAGV